MPLPEGLIARFKIHLRCINCMRNVPRILDVPDEDDAPRDIDELLESAFFHNQRFVCASCDSAIANVIGITRWQADEAAA